jgi:hypothetical protein
MDMAGVVAALLLSMALAPASAITPLPSRELPVAYVELAEAPLENFDIFDVRFEMRQPPQYVEVAPHSIFVLRPHIGIAAGYDQGIIHGSLGFYLTVAEVGRWSFAAPSPGIGFGRYQVYNAHTQQSLTEVQSTILVSLASVHFRGGYLRSINKNWYVTFEQVFDARANINGSQMGISFANR